MSLDDRDLRVAVAKGVIQALCNKYNMKGACDRIFSTYESMLRDIEKDSMSDLVEDAFSFCAAVSWLESVVMMDTVDYDSLRENVKVLEKAVIGRAVERDHEHGVL
ncbi:MAG: hypothetical protein DRO14_00395 [Thermoprotei archaeon]|nr:MAG: hypothetical protein DRO14_00040 [Thermoprotei archaeon]RLG78608.1 MAG: hypothetical protein DRO14_00395 [Thermoprotei archaeon]